MDRDGGIELESRLVSLIFNGEQRTFGLADR
jgi:hypothetical protein